jgi:hypothetical protein
MSLAAVTPAAPRSSASNIGKMNHGAAFENPGEPMDAAKCCTLSIQPFGVWRSRSVSVDASVRKTHGWLRPENTASFSRVGTNGARANPRLIIEKSTGNPAKGAVPSSRLWRFVFQRGRRVDLVATCLAISEVERNMRGQPPGFWARLDHSGLLDHGADFLSVDLSLQLRHGYPTVYDQFLRGQETLARGL